MKDTRGELRHVAWPTQTQTIVYTILVALLSVGVSLYLGLFDFLFTTGLTRAINIFPSSYGAPAVQVQQQSVQTTPAPVAPTTQDNVLQLVPGIPSPSKTPAKK